jgi:hypothetical protein
MIYDYLGCYVGSKAWRKDYVSYNTATPARITHFEFRNCDSSFPNKNIFMHLEVPVHHNCWNPAVGQRVHHYTFPCWPTLRNLSIISGLSQPFYAKTRAFTRSFCRLSPNAPKSFLDFKSVTRLYIPARPRVHGHHHLFHPKYVDLITSTTQQYSSMD